MQAKLNSIWIDSVLVCSSFVLAFGFVAKLDPEKRVSLPLAGFLVTLGATFFVSSTSLFNKLMLGTNKGLKFIKHFNLSLSDVLDISNK